jgi:DNA modification methylase
MGEDDLARAEEAPEPPVEPVTVPGDVWLLGKHRLVCGDSTSADDVAKALNGVKPHLMVTDPPYGVEYDANWRNEAKRADGTKIGASAVGKVENDHRADWSEAWALFPGDVAYVWHAGSMAHTVADSLIKLGLNIRAQIIWAKSQFVIGRGHYHQQHEPCWYAVRAKGGATGHWQGSRTQATLWEIEHRKSDTGHSTQKPIECMKRPIENNSAPGDAIYEPFSGSGTTIIAAELTGRRCHALELSPAYVDVAIRRWQDLTGKQAIHADTGEVFNDLAVARLKKGEVHGSRGNAAPARDKKRAGKNAR